ncbi:MAG: putative toxin-antitoxin system toxin component, PIN family [bacterium]
MRPDGSGSARPLGPGRPPRLVVDTNLFVAWLFRPAAPGPRRLLDAWRAGQVRFCVSAPVLREIRATLSRLPGVGSRCRELLADLEDPQRTEFVDPAPNSGFRCADPADDKFLDLALAASADALVTSDRALLEVEGFPIPIVKSSAAPVQWSGRDDRSEG